MIVILYHSDCNPVMVTASTAMSYTYIACGHTLSVVTHTLSEVTHTLSLVTHTWSVVTQTLSVVKHTTEYRQLQFFLNVHMDGVVREVNVRMLGKGLELLSVNGGRFEINQLLFADDAALVADSEEKLCRLVNGFGRVCERRNCE